MASIGTDPVSGATIQTDQDDYVPGQIVHVTGSGWAANETVHLFMTEDPDTHGDVEQDVQADSVGAFSIHFYDVQGHDLGVTFTLTATGQTSGSSATAVFTDGTISNAAIAMRDAATCTSATSTVNVNSPICAAASFTITLAGATHAQFRWKSPANVIAAITQRSPSFPNGTSGAQTFSANYTPTTAGTWTVLLCESQNSDLAPGGVAGCQGSSQKASQTFTVTARADQTITFGVLANKTYGNPDFAVSATASSGLPVSFVAVGTCSISGVDVHITGAGSCTITASQAGNASYNAAPDVEQSFTIAQAVVTATAGSGSGTYNGFAHNPSACVVTGAYTGDLSCANNPATVGPDAGTTTISPMVSGTGLSNFDISSQSGSFTIEKAPVTATAGSGSGTYNGATHTPSACAVTGVYTGDLSCTNSPATVGPNAGTTTINPDVSGSGLSNFDITAVDGSFTIEKAPVTATAGSGSGTYNGATHTPSECSVTGAYTGDLSCANDPATVGPNAGTTTISPDVSGSGLSNFDITSVDGSFTIERAPVTATAGSGSGTYNGATHTPSECAVTGAYTGDLSCANDPAEVGPNAGTTTISPVVSGPGQSNFDITAINGSFTIAKANASITVYGYTGIFDGLAHGATGSATGVGGANLTGALNLGASFTYPTGGTAHWTFDGDASPANGNYNDVDGDVQISIQAWTLNGFYQPVDMNGVYNIVKGGSTVPLKFEIFAGSVERTGVADVRSFVVNGVSCSPTTPIDEIELTTTGGTTLRYDAVAGQFIQNWQTPKLPGQCYRVTMTTQDNSTLTAFFKLK